MKIAIFTDTFFPQVNGVVRVVDLSARGLVELGHEVMVVAPSSETDADIAARKLGYRVMRVKSIPVPLYPGERLSWGSKDLYRAIGAFQPDILHVHTPFLVGRVARKIKRRLDIPLVGTHHTFFDHYLKYIGLDIQSIRELSWRFTVGFYNHCDLNLLPTKALLDAMVLHGLVSPARTLKNPVETALFEPFETEEQRMAYKKQAGYSGPTMVYMGRIAYEKSLDDVVSALAMARTKVPDLRLIMVGDGPDRARLEANVRSRGLSGVVDFVGTKHGTRLRDEIRMHDIFVSAATSENMPVSVLEAMSAGLPVAAVAALGMPEIVLDGKTGLLAPIGDIPKLAENIVRIVTNPALRAELSRAAHCMALEHKPATIAKTLAAEFTSMHAKA
jgi:glycosyltransferase involved in cell wall biosynthesis